MLLYQLVCFLARCCKRRVNRVIVRFSSLGFLCLSWNICFVSTIAKFFSNAISIPIPVLFSALFSVFFSYNNSFLDSVLYLPVYIRLQTGALLLLKKKLKI